MSEKTESEGIWEWMRPRTDAEMDEIEKTWVKNALECGDVRWLAKYGYDHLGNKKSNGSKD